jgi:hypothetical protein
MPMMAKRKAAVRTRKAARKTSRKAVRKASKPARKSPSRKATRASRPAARGSKSAARPKTRPRKAAAPKAAPRKKSLARPAPAALSRERRQLREDDVVPTPPSTLDYTPKASSAESGHNMYHHRQREHTEGGPSLTGGDVDVDWNEAYSSGEETPGGDMPTPDHDVVEEIGRALGVEYEDAEELKGAEKIENRDRHRWEYDPASAEDYKDRNRRDED